MSIKLIGGVNGREPKPGDVIELQGQQGAIYRTVDWTTCEYVNYRRPNDYQVRLLKGYATHRD